MKLKPVPEKTVHDKKDLFNNIWNISDKQDEIIDYLKYLREHIQQLEDMRHE